MPTAVAGIYGMNFDMPELKLVWVYLACLGFIAVACLMLFLRESRYLAGRTADGMIAVGCASSATGIEDRRNVPRRTNTRG